MAEANAKIEPLAGTTTVDEKMTFEPQRLSYVAARDVAREVAAAVAPALGTSPVVIADDAFLADIGNLGTAQLQIDMLTDDYRRIAASLAPPAADEAASRAVAPAALALPAVTAGLQGALGLVALLRENVEFHGVETHIDSRAFEITVAAALRERGIEQVYVPDLVVVRTPGSGPGSLRGKVEEMQDARHKAWQAAGPLLAELARKDTELDAAARIGTPERVAAVSRDVVELRKRVEPLTDTLGTADRRLSELQAQWDKTSESTGLTMLARLLRAEALHARNPRYLHATVVSSGGHNRVTRNLFRTLFLGDGLSSLGGVVVRWAVLESDGTMKQGGVRWARRAARFPRVAVDQDEG